MKTSLLVASTAIVLSTMFTPASFANQSTILSAHDTSTTVEGSDRWQPRTFNQQNSTNVSNAQSITQLKVPMTAQKHPKCTGDAAKATPPIPNNPTHIRNVIWRNMRTMCS